MNNISENKQRKVSTIIELDSISKRYAEIKKMTKLDFEDNRNEFEELHRQLLNGILLEKNATIEIIYQNILLFLVKKGYPYEKMQNILNNTIFKISIVDTLTGSNALAFSSGKNIIIDKSLIDYDENGNIIGINKENKDFLMYILTHELFHHLSTYRENEMPPNVKDSALSEGITEFLTEEVTNYQGERKSKTYCFSKNIIKLLSKIIGPDIILSDYINNIGTYPQLNQFFSSYDVDFNKFEHMMDKALYHRYQKTSIDDIYLIEKNILFELKEKIIIPYIKEHPEQSIEIISTFNELFKEYNEELSIENNNNRKK